MWGVKIQLHAFIPLALEATILLHGLAALPPGEISCGRVYTLNCKAGSIASTDTVLKRKGSFL